MVQAKLLTETVGVSECLKDRIERIVACNKYSFCMGNAIKSFLSKLTKTLFSGTCSAHVCFI